MRTLSTLVALTLLSTTPISGASACDIPANTIINCGFDSGILNWTQTAGVFSHTTTDGSSQAGALNVRNDMFGESTFQFHQCVPVQTNTTYALGMKGRIIQGNINCSLLVSFRSDIADCPQGPPLSSILAYFPFPLPTTWTPAEAAELNSGAGTVAWFDVLCDFAEFSEANFDDAYLFPVNIFADGFESGNMSAWSSTVP